MVVNGVFFDGYVVDDGVVVYFVDGMFVGVVVEYERVEVLRFFVFDELILLGVLCEEFDVIVL